MRFHREYFEAHPALSHPLDALTGRRQSQLVLAPFPLLLQQCGRLAGVFLANPNRVLSRDQLLMHTRNREWEPFDRSIDIRIGRLRRKVEPDPSAEPRCIRTVRNAGYMYVPGA